MAKYLKVYNFDTIKAYIRIYRIGIIVASGNAHWSTFVSEKIKR